MNNGKCYETYEEIKKKIMQSPFNYYKCSMDNFIIKYIYV